MIVHARFTAEVASQERTAEVVGEHGHYEVFVSDQTQHRMARVLETDDFTAACRKAREWMDSIDLQAALT